MLPTVPPPIAAPPALALDDPALRNKLMAYAVLRIRHREAAEDAVQEALARAVKRQTTFDAAAGALVTWVFGILNLVIREEWRKQKRQPIQPAAEPAAWEALAAKMDPARDPSVLAELLGQLPEPSRRIVTMHHLDGLSHQEIGDQLGISRVNSRVRLGRALDELKQLAAKEGAR